MGGGGEVTASPLESYWASPAFVDVDVPEQFRLSLGEGGTPVLTLPDIDGIVFKREDLNPTGSHKDRAACFQLARAASLGVPGVVISSSGNAGIATSRYAELHGLPAWVCVHPDTDADKLAAIDGATTTLIVTERAINTAKLLARELGMPNLRPSVHDDALIGYQTLGHEIADIDCDAVVIFATSGASAIAVAQVFEQRFGSTRPVCFVQGEGNAALADPTSNTTDASAHAAAAGRLGVRRSRRARQLSTIVAATGGRGVVASHGARDRARALMLEHGVQAGDESCANVAVALDLAASGQRIACVLSGSPATARRDRMPAARMTAVDEHDALAQVRAAIAVVTGGER